MKSRVRTLAITAGSALVTIVLVMMGDHGPSQRVRRRALAQAVDRDR